MKSLMVTMYMQISKWERVPGKEGRRMIYLRIPDVVTFEQHFELVSRTHSGDGRRVRRYSRSTAKLDPME
jgi:hypothetical protein